MPDLALPRQLHAIGQRAIAEAVRRRATAVGAEHVLLAIAADPDAATASTLASAGLDYIGIAAALAAERERSLAVADVDPIDPALLRSAPRPVTPGWGASVRDLLRTADKPTAKSGPGALELELTIGILRAELGTVPRALALADIDRPALIRQLARIRLGS